MVAAQRNREICLDHDEDDDESGAESTYEHSSAVGFPLHYGYCLINQMSRAMCV